MMCASLHRQTHEQDKALKCLRQNHSQVKEEYKELTILSIHVSRAAYKFSYQALDRPAANLSQSLPSTMRLAFKWIAVLVLGHSVTGIPVSQRTDAGSLNVARGELSIANGTEFLVHRSLITSIYRCPAL